MRDKDRTSFLFPPPVSRGYRDSSFRDTTAIITFFHPKIRLIDKLFSPEVSEFRVEMMINRIY